MEPALLPPLAWFARVARHGSFTKAAAEMGVTRAALSQNLKVLEQRLGCRLLHRTTRDMSLTDEGRHLLDTLQPALAEIERGVQELGEAGREPSGLLRVNTSRVAAKLVLEPHLGEFLAANPKLQLELVMDDGYSNIVAEGCDAGIRFGESVAEHMMAVPVTPRMEMAVAATPAYLKRHGVPQSPAELARHNCIRYRQTSSGAIFRWEFSHSGSDGHAFVVEPHGSITTNDDEGMIRAALQGVGLVQHLEPALRPWLEDGRLVRVLQPWCKAFPGLYLYAPTREQMPAKVRALIDFLVEKRDVMGGTRSGTTSKGSVGYRRPKAPVRSAVRSK
ncbi:MAG: LysR family transcriptional regulator [Piscinibacter sp.]|uniref:LysR family transcriptional regulator n=1 Tax=Piscinibacter sp. TaxID=1903157 RepID=UPI001B49B6A4|nr:LysR family transcriptional regulator [Piscinibacter sp.]MBP5988788.1 LysR family transcriptional regulator [Piscinibacter sp.]MBP6025723.1 LysR family transcriptional regulator [Piscinibacter sp.]